MDKLYTEKWLKSSYLVPARWTNIVFVVVHRVFLAGSLVSPIGAGALRHQEKV